MKIQIKNDCYVVGDIHGEAKALTDIFSYYNIKDCTIILLGDIGIWRYRDYKRYRCLDEYGKNNNVIIYCFRGNHDNPSFFMHSNESSPIVKRFWNKFTNFKVIPDLTVIEINNSKGIVIGGGLSIDRSIRRSFQYQYRNNSNSIYKNNDWWKNEIIPNTRFIEGKFDFILSHVGPRPTKIHPLNEKNCGFFKLDYELKDAIETEINHLEEIQRQFQPKKWWFGHFHINDAFDFNETRCYAVDILHISPILV